MSKDLREALRRLKRIADPTEITGDGATEDMTGPAANEMRWRMKEAGKLVDIFEALISSEVLQARIDELERAKMQSYIHGTLMHKVNRRIAQLKERLGK